MIEFQRKKRFKKILYSPLTLILLLIIFLFLVRGVYGVYKKERISAKNLEKQALEIARLSSRRADLTQSIDYMKTDEGIETEVRSKFRFVKEGESIAVIVDDEASNTAKLLVASTTPEKSGFWSRFIGLFGL